MAAPVETEMQHAAVRILIVGNRDTGGEPTASLLEGRSAYAIENVVTPEDTESALDRFNPHCLLLTSRSSVSNARLNGGKFATVLLTDESEKGLVGLEQFHDHVRLAGLTFELLDRVIRNAIEKAALQRENRQLEDELHEWRAQLELAQEAGCLGTWAFDLTEGSLTCSSLCPKLYGREGEAADWSNIWDKWVHPDERNRLADELNNALNGVPFDTEFRVMWPDESLHWLRAHGKMRHDSTRGKRFYGATADITDTRNRAEQLTRSNSDLEKFAYVASHDLQEPLRNVMSFSELFARRNKGVDAESKQYLEYIKQGGRRMQALVSDLLTFSRVTQAGHEMLEPVNCNEVFTEALGEMQAPVKESGARIEVGELPQLIGSSQQLMQLLQNLVGNAIKFRGTEAPVVKVSATRASRGWQFSIVDNGIGLEMEYADRIFEAFRRLHGRDEYPGTGLGLAICKRIVERHGGRIWVESEPGKGSKFFFTISDMAAAATAAG